MVYYFIAFIWSIAFTITLVSQQWWFAYLTFFLMLSNLQVGHYKEKLDKVENSYR